MWRNRVETNVILLLTFRAWIPIKDFSYKEGYVSLIKKSIITIENYTFNLFSSFWWLWIGWFSLFKTLHIKISILVVYFFSFFWQEYNLTFGNKNNMNLSSKVGALKQNTKSTKHSKELRKCWRKINDKKARSLKKCQYTHYIAIWKRRKWHEGYGFS